MWPHWLHEAVDAAVAALDARQVVQAQRKDLDGPPPAENVQALQDALDIELRASMRSISSSAFAVDAFYAAVQARSPAHPDREKWRTPRADGRRTSRQAIVFETLRYQLKIRPALAPEFRKRIDELFRYRSWAVHADAKFKPAVGRPDVERGVDWHYAAFRTENAVTVVGGTLQMLGALVDRFDEGSDEMREWQPYARETLDAVTSRYDADERFPRMQWRNGAAPGAG